MAVKFGVKARELKENPVNYLTIFGRVKRGSLKLKTAPTRGDAPSLFRGHPHVSGSDGVCWLYSSIFVQENYSRLLE